MTQVNHSIPTVASSTLLTPSSGRSRFNTVLWISLGLTALLAFITSEVLLATDFPIYHAYRLQVIADRHLLIPRTLCGVIALAAGPMQLSPRLRRRRLGETLSGVGVIAFTLASLLAADLGLNWRELTTRRA